MTKKKRKSSRSRCASRKAIGSVEMSYGTPTWFPAMKPQDDPIPLNRQAAKQEAARERGGYGAFVKKEQRTIRKAKVKRARRVIAKIRKATKRAMAAAQTK